jgi:hypothetical protein
MAAADITANDLRRLLRYDPETGLFTWLERTGNARWNAQFANKPAGSLDPGGYVKVLKQWAHRLAWLYMHGEWPKGQIDHINGKRDDNRLANLRDGTRKANMENRHTANKKRSGLPLGVTFDKRRGDYSISLTHNYRRIYRGSFATPEEAHTAYLIAKRKHHAACTI